METLRIVLLGSYGCIRWDIALEKPHIKIRKPIVFVAESTFNVDFFAQFSSQVPLEAITYKVELFGTNELTRTGWNWLGK